jgi:hypothetical protein
MNKFIVVLLALIVIALNSNAQIFRDRSGDGTDTRDQLHLGVKIGANFSNVYDSKGEEFNADGKLGFAAGAFASVPIGRYFGIQPEILFSQKGFQASTVILGTTYSFTRTTNFIDVPLLFKIKPIEMVSILAGPQYSYLIKQKDVYSNSNASVEQQHVFETQNIRKNILGFTGGVDVNIKYIVLSARFGWDFINNNGDGTSTSPRYKNAWSQFTLGFRF